MEAAKDLIDVTQPATDRYFAC